MMHIHIGYFFLRCLNVIGGFCLYAGLFLYEDEEGRFQNRVQQLWVKVDDVANASRSHVAAFMQEVARLTGIFLDSLFGVPIRYLRLIGISICFSMASFFLSVLLSIAFNKGPKVPDGGNSTIRATIISLIYFLFLALVPAITTNKWCLRLWGAVVMCQLLPLLSFLLFLRVHYSPQRAALGIEVFLILFATSLIFDVLYIYVTRKMLRHISEADLVHHIISVIADNVLVLGTVLALPWVIGFALFRYAQHFSEAVIGSFFLNSIDVLAGSAALIIALLLLLHRLLWPAIERPLYAMQRFNVIKNKKVLISCGATLLALPTETIGGAILQILSKLF